MIYVELSDKRNVILLSKLKARFAASGFSLIEKGAFGGDGATAAVFSPSRRITPDEAEKLPRSSVVFGGAQGGEVLARLRRSRIKYHNFLADERFAVNNAKLAAEGALALILQNADKSLSDARILVLGCGRIGKSLCNLLGRIGAKTAVATLDREEYDACPLYAESAYFGLGFKRRLGAYDVVVNTVPKVLFDGGDLERVGGAAVFIDLASFPCVRDEDANAFPFKYVRALGLPAAFAAESAADEMLRCVLRGLKGFRSGKKL